MYNSDSSSTEQLNPWQQWAFRIEQRLQEQQDTIDTLRASVSELQKQLNQQQNQNSIQSATPIFHVDKIEYHFDQLKVETLEGSLQIGMSTASGSQLPTMIEELAMKQKTQQPNSPIQSSKANSPNASSKGNANNPSKNKANSSLAPYQSSKSTNNHYFSQPNYSPDGVDSSFVPAGFEQYLFDQMRKHLLEQGVSYIRRQSSLFNVPMDDEHISLIISDLERQLGDRIDHYLAEQIPTFEARNEDEHIDNQHMLEQLQQTIKEKTWHDIETAITLYLQGKA